MLGWKLIHVGKGDHMLLTLYMPIYTLKRGDMAGYTYSVLTNIASYVILVKNKYEEQRIK